MSIALVMTVRDEVELLRDNLVYHHYLGVRIAYVYDDGSTDGTPDSVADLPFVSMASSVRPPDASVAGDADDEARRYVTSRQNLNTLDAMQRARADGADWLLAIDADELACVDLEAQEPGALAAALDRVPAGVEAVILHPLENVQRRIEFPDVMAGETLFKRADVGLRHRTLDPFTGRVHTVRGVYGHTAGKSVARLSADLRPATVHRFRRADGSPARSEPMGWLLHYYCHSFEAFVRKFRLIADHPDRHLRGHEVQLQKRLWREVVNRSGMSDDELREYFRAWVQFDEATIARLRRPGRRFGIVRRRAAVVEVTAAVRAFERIRAQAPASADGRRGRRAT